MFRALGRLHGSWTRLKHLCVQRRRDPWMSRPTSTSALIIAEEQCEPLWHSECRLSATPALSRQAHTHTQAHKRWCNRPQSGENHIKVKIYGFFPGANIKIWPAGSLALRQPARTRNRQLDLSCLDTHIPSHVHARTPCSSARATGEEQSDMPHSAAPCN